MREIIAGPFWAGLFSVFPAVLLSSLVILTRVQSLAFAQATGKTLILGSTNLIIYALAVYFTYPRYGLGWGTLISLIAAFVWVAMLHPLIRKTG